MLAKLLAIMDNVSLPLHKTADKLKSSFSNKLIQHRCLKEQYRKSFLPGAIRHYNAHSKKITHTFCALCYNLRIKLHLILLHIMFHLAFHFIYLNILFYFITTCFFTYCVYSTLLFLIASISALIFVCIGGCSARLIIQW